MCALFDIMLVVCLVRRNLEAEAVIQNCLIDVNHPTISSFQLFPMIKTRLLNSYNVFM